MANQINQDVLTELNGSIFLANAQGETQTKDPSYLLLFDTNVNAGNIPCIANENMIANDLPNEIPMTNAQILEFLAINMHQIQTTVLKEGGQPRHTDEQAAELAVLRLLAFRNRLAFRPANLATWHVEYVDVLGGDITAAGNAVNERHDQVDAQAFAIKNQYVAAINGMTGHIKKLTSNFSNIVCVVAYVFRSRGHHYLPDFDTVYGSLWEKCRCDLVTFKSKKCLTYLFVVQMTLLLHSRTLVSIISDRSSSVKEEKTSKCTVCYLHAWQVEPYIWKLPIHLMYIPVLTH